MKKSIRKSPKDKTFVRIYSIFEFITIPRRPHTDVQYNCEMLQEGEWKKKKFLYAHKRKNEAI